IEAHANRLMGLESAKAQAEIEYNKKKEIIESFEKRKRELEDTLEKTGYSGETKETIDERRSQYLRLEGTLEKMKGDLERKTELEKMKSESAKKSSELKEKIKTLENAVEKVGYDPEAEKMLRKERDDASEKKHATESSAKSMEADIKRLEQQKQEVEKRMQEHMDLYKDYASSNEKIKLLDEARNIFHRDRGVAKYLRETYINRLNRILTVHFKSFNQNPKYQDISFDRDYSINIRTSSGNLDAKQLSGGELVQLALALRLTLIDLMSPMRLMILDEPFGSLDETHRELLGIALNKIAATGQLVIVSHIPVESMQLENQIDLGGY
ncbi:MAG: hypothetical protein KKD39_01475, partial [Candidatus Altiarchaeota archaeon]|nr:hypothetical protein [Candidatus Altiarchaeota archaeon]